MKRTIAAIAASLIIATPAVAMATPSPAVVRLTKQRDHLLHANHVLRYRLQVVGKERNALRYIVDMDTQAVALLRTQVNDLAAQVQQLVAQAGTQG